MRGRHLDWFAETGRLERCAPRVWRLVGSPETWEQRLMMGLLSLGKSAAVSHDAAAQLHHFDRTPADIVEFIVPRVQRQSRMAETVHSSRTLRGIDVISLAGFRVTSATRTILDLANAQVGVNRLRAAIDTAVRTQTSAPETLARRLRETRGRGRTGVELLDELLVDSGGHTMLERYFLTLMRENHLPRPETQVVFRKDGRTFARVDFLYREFNIVVEVSGQLGHSSPTERARDAQRRNELQDIGLRVYEFTWEDITHRPMEVVAQMRSRLVAAGWAA